MMSKGQAKDPKTDKRRLNKGRPKSDKSFNESVLIRMTTEQRAKYAALGGASWVREQIGKA